MELLKEIGAFAGLVAFLGLAVLALLSFAQGRDLRRLREWAGSAPERDAERKETTSAAASEKAEEMRRLEEAREAERRAADEREQRRERREAGLSESRLTERLGEPRYLIAIFAVFVLIAGGVAFALLSGGDGGAGGNGKGGKQQRALQPSEIEVTVLNGTAVDGLAGTYGDMVERRGFQLGAVTNSRSSFEDSIVMYEPGPGNARAAHRVADALEISRVRPMNSEIASLAAGAPVAVVIGEDNASTTG